MGPIVGSRNALANRLQIITLALIAALDVFYIFCILKFSNQHYLFECSSTKTGGIDAIATGGLPPAAPLDSTAVWKISSIYLYSSSIDLYMIVVVLFISTFYAFLTIALIFKRRLVFLSHIFLAVSPVLLAFVPIDNMCQLSWVHDNIDYWFDIMNKDDDNFSTKRKIIDKYTHIDQIPVFLDGNGQWQIIELVGNFGEPSCSAYVAKRVGHDQDIQIGNDYLNWRPVESIGPKVLREIVTLTSHPAPGKRCISLKEMPRGNDTGEYSVINCPC